MNKIAFSLIISGWALQEQLGLPDNAETLHVSVEYPVDGRFNITSIKITRCTNVVKSGSSYCESFGPYLFERYVRSIRELKDNIKGQHELVELVKAFIIQYLESLNVLDIQDGDKIEFDDVEVVA